MRMSSVTNQYRISLSQRRPPQSTICRVTKANGGRGGRQNDFDWLAERIQKELDRFEKDLGRLKLGKRNNVKKTDSFTVRH